MNNYKIIINIPNEKNTTEVLITEEQLNNLESALNSKRLVKINGSYFNTTYIAKIIPDMESTLLENPKFLELEQTSDTSQVKKNKEEIEKLRNKFNFKK